MWVCECICGFCNVWVCACVGFICGCFENCVGVLVICVLLFIVFLCCFFYVHLFLFVTSAKDYCHRVKKLQYIIIIIIIIINANRLLLGKFVVGVNTGLTLKIMELRAYILQFILQ